jgi:hypothetical protein
MHLSVRNFIFDLGPAAGAMAKRRKHSQMTMMFFSMSEQTPKWCL